jgi:metal-responsive CopG/Arc/MetJ family transcriptional regulator
MRTKKKISVTIDAEIFEAIEKAAETCNIAKSRLAQEAFRLWLKKRTEELMAAGYIEMAREDGEFADTTLDAQKEILS